MNTLLMFARICLSLAVPSLLLGCDGTGVSGDRPRSDDERPLLAMSTLGPPDAPFRVIASEAWGPVANIPLANMDWQEFSDHVDDDGVHRGF